VIAADFIAFTATAMPLAPTPSAEALFQQSIAHMESGDAAGAEGLLRKALDLAPGFADALTNLGFLLTSGATWPVRKSLIHKHWRPGPIRVNCT
jgi:hypothetical protein